MAAFHPETIRRLRRELAAVETQHKRDLTKRTKHDVLSKSLMAQRLDDRIAEGVAVMRDLDRLIAFAEGVNQVYTEHERGEHEGRPRRNCADCDAEGARPAAAELLSSTPLATAFGAAPAVEAEEVLAVGDVLDEHDPEPPVGTVVMLHDGSDEKWKRLDEPGEWHWAAEHQGYQTGVWRWRRVTFDGPVTVVEVPGESGAGR